MQTIPDTDDDFDPNTWLSFITGGAPLPDMTIPLAHCTRSLVARVRAQDPIRAPWKTHPPDIDIVNYYIERVQELTQQRQDTESRARRRQPHWESGRK